jgi:predicted secreted hydrolase
VLRLTARGAGVVLEGTKMWRSTRSFLTFPTEWELVIPGKCKLTLKAKFPDQELLTMLVGAFWEGRLEVSGVYDGKPVRRAPPPPHTLLRDYPPS